MAVKLWRYGSFEGPATADPEDETLKLKRLVTDLSLDKLALEHVQKKDLSPKGRKRKHRMATARPQMRLQK